MYYGLIKRIECEYCLTKQMFEFYKNPSTAKTDKTK